MDNNHMEARKALERAETRFSKGDLQGAVQMALKAKRLFPNLHGIAGYLAAYSIHSACGTNSERPDWYAALNATRSCSLDTIRRHFKELRALIHPDKNSSAAAEGAFKLIYAAWEAVFEELGGCRSSSSTAGGGCNSDEEEDEDGGGSSSHRSGPQEKPSCPECSRRCHFLDSRRMTIECRRCELIAMRSGKDAATYELIIRDGISRIDIRGEGGDTQVNGASRIRIYGGGSIMLNRCKGVELKGGDTVHISSCTNININGTGNISYG